MSRTHYVRLLHVSVFFAKVFTLKDFQSYSHTVLHYKVLQCFVFKLLKELGKYRAIRVVGDKVVGKKNPEVDHHPNCEPLPESVVLAQEVDRGMRNDVREHGKRPRDAYNTVPHFAVGIRPSSEAKGPTLRTAGRRHPVSQAGLQHGHGKHLRVYLPKP